MPGAQDGELHVRTVNYPPVPCAGRSARWTRGRTRALLWRPSPNIESSPSRGTPPSRASSPATRSSD
eukprot:417781-Pyramimonas_sp.AAC.1